MFSQRKRQPEGCYSNPSSIQDMAFRPDQHDPKCCSAFLFRVHSVRLGGTGWVGSSWLGLNLGWVGCFRVLVLLAACLFLVHPRFHSRPGPAQVRVVRGPPGGPPYPFLSPRAFWAHGRFPPACGKSRTKGTGSGLCLFLFCFVSLARFSIFYVSYFLFSCSPVFQFSSFSVLGRCGDGW